MSEDVNASAATDGPANRYFVDERAGCVAVRDRDETEPDYPGLHCDTKGVVFYRHGRQVEKRWLHRW